jgi:signal transduction histidine kinase
MTVGATDVPTERALLRHFLAALAYRTAKALRHAPAGFADFSAGHRIRTPAEVIRHMTSLVGYARSFFIGGVYHAEPLATFAEEVERFHAMLDALSSELRSDRPFLGEMSERRMLQGPLADAMTHAGQLAILRRMYGSPVPPENFIFAHIAEDRLGPDQAEPARPDDEWPEAP